MTQSQELRGKESALLRRCGYEVFEASDALEAQRQAAVDGKIDLLLLNLDSVGLRDFQLALWFRATYPEIRVLVACAPTPDLDLKMGASQRMAILVRPFKNRELARAVRQMLGREG